MTSAAGPAFPGSRPLGAWWRQLAPLRPRALWVAHLWLHKVEALVQIRRRGGPDRLAQLLLEILTIQAGQRVTQLDQHLHLGIPVVTGLLRNLGELGFVTATSGGTWSVTPPGEQALRQETTTRSTQERRTFYFLDRGPSAPPHFLALTPDVAKPSDCPEGWAFDPKHLKDCVRRPPEWKRRFGFAEEVEEVLELEPDGTPNHVVALGHWRRVIVDHAEQLVVALARTAGPTGERFIGYSVAPTNWALGTKPVFELGPGWPEVFPAMANDPSAARWQEAWRSWALANGLSAAEAEACRLDRREHRLQARVPKAVVDKLRASRSDALRGGTWILAGDGRVRSAALLEITGPRSPARGP